VIESKKFSTKLTEGEKFSKPKSDRPKSENFQVQGNLKVSN